MRGALYARYSTDRQSDTSPEDQARLCGARALALGIEIIVSFEDRAVSGGIPIAARSGGRSLLAGAIAGDFEVILVEGLDRLSRDLVDQERVVRRLEHAGLRIVGVKDGYDSSSGKSRKILRQVRGMINEIYRDDAGENTRRGMIGQFHRGFHAGGMCFGYRTVAATGGRRLVIDPEQAHTVEWIFERAGIDRRSDGWIAEQLNARDVRSKHGGQWKNTAVRELLRQPLVTGKVIFNRYAWIKDPDSGRRRYRQRPESEWLTRQDESVRIVSDELWRQVQLRNAEIWERRGRKVSERVKAAIAAKEGRVAAALLGLKPMRCADCGSLRVFPVL